MDSSQNNNNPLIQDVADLDRRLVRRLRKASNDSWLDIEMPLPVLRALLAVERAGRLTPSEIAEYIGVSRSTCSSILDALENDGYVERAINPADRRQFFIAATPAGRALAERIDGHRRGRLLEALEHLAPHELEALATGLAALDRALGALEVSQAEATPAAGRAR